MAVSEYEAAFLNNAEYNSDPSIIGSIGAGIATGLIRIPEGAISLFANIYDLTNDTDTATEVEEWFDENIYQKLGNLEEKAEATTAGKITAALVNIGVPGGLAFRYGTKMANTALRSAKNGKYFTLNNPTLAKAGQKALELNKKGKTLKFMAGATAGGAAEGVFVADAEEFGTLGDLLGGPTAINDEPTGGGRDEATRAILNRIKFGTEGALLTGVIGGTGSLIKKVVTRGKELKYSRGLMDRWINKAASGFRSRGDLPEEAFLTKREQIGKRNADLTRASYLARLVDRDIDRIFPNLKSSLNKTTRAEKFQVYKDLEDVLFSGTSTIDDVGRVSMGEMDGQLVSTISKKLLNNGAKPEHVANIFNNLGQMRGKWNHLATLLRSKLPPEAQATFKNIIRDHFKQWMGRTYEVFENKSAIPFFNYKPTEQAFNRVASIFMRQNRRAISRAEAAKAGGKDVAIPDAMTKEQADWLVNDILKTVKQDKSLMRIAQDAETIQATRTPEYLIPSRFVKDSVADDLIRNNIFLKRLEQSASKGRYALPGPEGLPSKTVIGRGSQAFRELFGEVKDVRQKMLHGTERLSMIARKNEFYDKLLTESDRLAAEGGRAFFYGSRDAAKTGLNNIDVDVINRDVLRNRAWGETPGTNPLLAKYPNGAWMDKDLAESLLATNKRLINDKTVSFIYDSLFLMPKATSQFAKTVLSPITHARNFFSAATFQTANGIWFENPKVLGKAWKEAFGALQPQTFKMNRKAGQEAYEELVELGVVNTNVRAQEIGRLMSDAKMGQRLTTDRAARMMLQPGWFKKFAKWSQDMYVAEDDFWKMGSYAIEKYRYKSAYAKAFSKGLIKEMPTERQFKEMSADIVRNTVPNYDYVPQFIRNLRRMPIGNFVSFPAEILRTGSNIFQQSIKEIKNPITRSIGMKRLAGLTATTAILPPAMVELFKTIYDYTDEEVAALKRFLPEWSKNSTILPMRDDDDNLKYIDFSHGFAYDTLTRPFQTILNAVASGETNEEALTESFIKGLATSTAELGQPFIAESIWTEAFLDVLRGGGKTKDGKVLYTDQTPVGERVTAIISHLVKAQAPFSLQQMIRLGFAATGKPTKPMGPYTGTGQEYDLSDEALGFTGYRPVPIDPARSLDFMISGYQRDIRNARREFNAKLLRGDPINPQNIIDRYIIANKAKWESMKDMSDNITAGQILGVENEDLANVLGRISKKDGVAMLTDQFIPFTVSENIQRAFQENANKLGVDNPFLEAAPALEELQKVMTEIPLSESEWPNLTELFNLEPLPEPPVPQNIPSGAATLNPAIYKRPSLTLGNRTAQTGGPNQVLTQNQMALLSPEEQLYYLRRNQRNLTT